MLLLTNTETNTEVMSKKGLNDFIFLDDDGQ